MALLNNLTFQNDLYFHVNNEHDLVSFETRHMFGIVNFVAICSIIGLFGVVTNALNMIVFCKQGFKNTMTISFMGLAISDMGCLITLLWFGVCENPLVGRRIILLVALEINTLTAGWPHLTFNRITGCITAYITAERCLCITAPLAVRNIITPKRTTGALVVIYVVNIVVVVPEYTTCYLGWKFYPDLNISLIGSIQTVDNPEVEGVVYLLHAMITLTFFVCVTVLTSVLVIKLKVASQWRHKATEGKADSEAMSTKDKKATSMVITISSLLIAMNLPGIVVSFAAFCEPKLGIYGQYQNLLLCLGSFILVFGAINSSANIFMYYNMSTKYREVFNMTFRPSTTKKK